MDRKTLEPFTTAYTLETWYNGAPLRATSFDPDVPLDLAKEYHEATFTRKMGGYAGEFGGQLSFYVNPDSTIATFLHLTLAEVGGELRRIYFEMARAANDTHREARIKLLHARRDERRARMQRIETNRRAVTARDAAQ